MESSLFEEGTNESSSNIRLINKSTILKICSGQVVTSLAIAVKELVENSIDAGATNIEINLKEFGLVSVEVFDNGSGVQESDINGLAVRYHTSKLKEFSDLRTVSTLGFRGEALSSLCSLSDVEITTRHQSSPFGWCLVYDHDGNIVYKKPCAHPVGTSVVISNLFVTLPVRKKEFSRNIKTEYNKLIELLRAYCLICKNIRIKCHNITNKGRNLVLHTKGNKSCIDNILDVFSSKQVSNLVKITSGLNNGQKYCVDSFQEVEKNLNIALKSDDVEKMNERIKFEGWFSSCAHGCGRSSTDRQYFYVNSRPCEPRQIKKLVNAYYRQFNNKQYPFVFLNIEINTYDMDINLTPDKRLILIHNETLILCMLKLSLYNIFRRIASTYKLQNIPVLPEINRAGTEVEVNDIGDHKSGAGISTKMSQFLSQFKADGNSERRPCNISKLNSKISLNTANKRRSIEDIMAENFKNKKIKISASKAKAKVTADLPISYSSEEEDNHKEIGSEEKFDCRNIPSSSIEPKVEYLELPKSQDESSISPYFQKSTEENGSEEKFDCRNIPSSSIEPKVEYLELPKSQDESSISPYFQKSTEENGSEEKFDCRNIPSSSIEPKVEYLELPKSQDESSISPYFQKSTEEIGSEEKFDCRNIPSSSIEPKVEYLELPKSQDESSISPYFQKSTVSSMEELLKRQTIREGEINRNIKNYKKANKLQKSSSGYLTKRVELLEGEWEIYKANHETMLENYVEETHSGIPYFRDDVFSNVEDKVFETIGAIYDILNDKAESSNQCMRSDVSQGQPSAGIQLPRIILPKFFGDYSTWSSFHDLFVSLIHENRTLSSVQKLHYLKSNLGGEAEQLIRHLQITDVNYDSAWRLLVKRYQNTRALLGAHLKTLFSLPIQSNETAAALKTLMDTTRECLESIKGLGIDTKNWDPLVLYILTQRLSVETLSDWELRLSKRDDPNEIPSLEEFLECIEARFRTLEAINSTRPRQHPKERHHNTIRSHNVSDLKEGSRVKSPSCSICDQSHQLKDCSKFLALTLQERRAIVQRGAHCYNCLRLGHSVAKCHSKFNCRICGGKHHILLHSHTGMQDSRQGNDSNSEEGAQQERLVHTSITSANKPQARALLATALILARTSEGYAIPLRALLDQGSEVSFISHAAAQRLRLKGTPTDLHINVVGGVEAAVAKKIVQFTICSRYKPGIEVSVEAYLLPRLTGLLPGRRIIHKRWTHLETLFLADPMYHNPGTIDVLLGVSVYAQVIEDGLRKGPHGSPLAQLTSFGWILSGGLEENHGFTSEHKTITTLHAEVQIDGLLRRFWELEEYPLQVHCSEDEERCEQVFRDTFQRQLDGRYSVKLPFNTPNMIPDLGESKQIAVRQLMQVERRLTSNPAIAKQYSDFMKDYEEQGHMETVSEKCQDPRANYLPHHYVLKETSTTTKLRVVFDASRKTSNKKSLNDNLLVGPTIQRDLVSILIRWRRHKVAFTADIKQMYRQILVDKHDTDFQRIVWRYQVNEPIREYRLLTVTYGTSCAPYLATRTLLQLAQDEAETFPNASHTLLHDFYVDDVLSGEDSVAEALKLQANLRQLLKQGRFELRKWVSNQEELLQQIPVEDRELDLPLDITRDVTIKALGIYWDPMRDIFSYKVNQMKYSEPWTKRKLLSSIARIFDPLGWLAPIVVTSKLLLQELWIKNLDWDSELSTQMETRWRNYSSQLKDIEQIQIKRWIHYTRKVRLVQLHVFSDASMQAYGACVYARIISEDGTIHTNLLIAKTKVAPIKPVTLPRLELCGAVLGTKLVRDTANVLEISTSDIYAWTDSKIVLAWLQSHPRQWKQFVANRVAEIQQTLQGTHWNYVASKENPADCASRGLSPLQLKEHDLWWSGPSWLLSQAEKWPTSLKIPAEEPTHTMSEEARNIKAHFASNSVETTGSFIDRFSSYSKLIRITAYCKRFCNNSKGDYASRRAGQLTVRELQEAEKQLIRLTQIDSFKDELSHLEGKRPLKVSSKIINLNPFLDNEGLLRVGGRLQNSNLTFNEMHPLILPADKPLSKLKIEELHKTTLHGGPQLMLNVLRKTYWVLGARKLVKRVIRNCMTCFRCTARTRSQLMGNLPGPRVKPSRPFSATGVDFAGPVEVKSRTGRGRIQTTKGYIALFICLSTRAIHLEAVSDLSTNAFLAAFKRFTGRRGLCQDLYSDCGTNFVGANRRLSEEHTSLLRSVSTDIREALTRQSINWHFIPPASPHFGGLWEAGVRSMKYHLRRIMRDVKLTFEELSTTLVQIEACLNSRPLCPLTDDPDDCNALTPGHFLVGDALLAPPETLIPDTQSTCITRWQLVQQQCQDFWKRWSREYLSRLQQRPKWLKKQPNVKVGELVLLKEENLPPARWLLARIEGTHQVQTDS